GTGTGFSFQDFVMMALRQRRLILSLWAAVLALAVIAMFALPPSYRAATKVLITSDRAQFSGTTQGQTTELVRTSQVTDADVSSEIEILKSRELIESVLKDMNWRATEPKPSFFARLLAAPGDLMDAIYRRIHNLNDESTDPQAKLAMGIAKGVE